MLQKSQLSRRVHLSEIGNGLGGVTEVHGYACWEGSLRYVVGGVTEVRGERGH